MEGKTKSKGFRIVLDIFIVLMILAAAAGIVVRSVIGNDDESGERRLGTILKLEITDEYYAVVKSLIAEGQEYSTMYFADCGEIAGYISRYEITGDADTEYSPSDKVNATVQVSVVDGFMKDGSFLVHGKNYLTPNEVIDFYTDTTLFTARVISVE